MSNYNWLLLQLFAGEGAGDGGGEGAAPGADAAVDAEQRLLELGVPADKIRKRAKGNAARPQAAPKSAPQVQQPTQQQAAAADPTEEPATEKPARMSWDEIMADPEYNKQMQSVVQSRLRSAKASEETLAKLTPALEVLARKHKLDPTNIDYDALAKAVSDDNGFYEDKALEMGVSVETAKKIDQEERATARAQRAEQQTIQQQMIQQHFQSLEQQGEALKKTFPNFDLRTELRNPVFARMTAPNSGLSLEDAYYAVHRKEIQAAAMQVTAQETAKKISNSIQAGQRRPAENGTTGQAASVTAFDYSKASPEQRAAFKAHIRSEAAHGRKVYPGGYTGK